MLPIKKLFTEEKVIIGMVHVPALPGTPMNCLSPKEIVEMVIAEAILYKEAGLKVLMIENMHDTPYLKGNVGHEISTLMGIIGYEIKRQTNLCCGIQILAAANKEAIAAAHSAGLDFIRAEGFVFGHLADEGIIESNAAEVLRYRKQIGADNILIFTDIKKKHSSHAISNDTSITDHAQAAEFFLSDGLIVTGKSTGLEANLEELIAVKKTSKLPVLIGSGVNPENIGRYYPHADGFIIGSYFKKEGNWKNTTDNQRLISLLNTIKKIS